MTVAVDFLTLAHRLIGVVAEGQTLSAEQGQTALTRLNQLMESLVVEGIDIGYFSLSSTTDELPMPLWAERGICSKLAKDLLAIYPSAQLSPEFLDDNSNGYALIVRTCQLQKLQARSNLHLGRGAGWGGATLWDIQTDRFR